MKQSRINQRGEAQLFHRLPDLFEFAAWGPDMPAQSGNTQCGVGVKSPETGQQPQKCT